MVSSPYTNYWLYNFLKWKLPTTIPTVENALEKGKPIPPNHLPVTAAFTLYHQVIRIVRHLALAIPAIQLRSNVKTSSQTTKGWTIFMAKKLNILNLKENAIQRNVFQKCSNRNVISLWSSDRAKHFQRTRRWKKVEPPLSNKVELKLKAQLDFSLPTLCFENADT